MNYFTPDTRVYPVVLVLYLPKRHVKSIISISNLVSVLGKRMHFSFFRASKFVLRKELPLPSPLPKIKAFRCGWSGRNLVWGAQRYSNEMISLLIMMVNLRNPWSLSQTNHQWKGSMVKNGWIGVDWGPGALKFMKIPKFQIKTPNKRTTWDEGCKGQSGKIRIVTMVAC